MSDENSQPARRLGQQPESSAPNQRQRKRKRDKPSFVQVNSESEDSATTTRGRSLARSSSKKHGVRTTPPSHPRSDQHIPTTGSKSQPEPARQNTHSDHSRAPTSGRAGPSARSNQKSHSKKAPSVVHSNARSRSASASRSRARSRSPSAIHPNGRSPLSATQSLSRSNDHSPSAPPRRPSSRVPPANGPNVHSPSTPRASRLSSATHPRDFSPTRTGSPTHRRMTGRTPSVQMHNPSFEAQGPSMGQNPAHSGSLAVAGTSPKIQHQLYLEPRRPMVPVENRNNAEHEGCRREGSSSHHEAPAGLQSQQGVQRNLNVQVDAGDERGYKRRRINSENDPPSPLPPNGRYDNPEPPHFSQMAMGSRNHIDRRSEYADNQRNHYFNVQRMDYMDRRMQERDYPHNYQHWDQFSHHPQDHYPPPPRRDQYPPQASSYDRYNGYPGQDRNSTPGPSYQRHDHSAYRNHEYYK